MSSKNKKRHPEAVVNTTATDDDEISFEVIESLPQVSSHRTSQNMTIYEFSALVTARAIQLTVDSPKGNYGTFNPIEIAKGELRDRLTTLVVRRKLSDGTIDDWKASDMIMPPL